MRALSEASLAGADFVLTGPEALSHARQVEVIFRLLSTMGFGLQVVPLTGKTRAARPRSPRQVRGGPPPVGAPERPPARNLQASPGIPCRSLSS